jgi:hypothetical protein
MSGSPKTAKARRRAIARRITDLLEEVLRASLITRYTTCGKPGCKCMRGEKHGPSYVASVTVAPGKTRQFYVRKDDVETVKALIDNYEEVWSGLVEISDINFELLRAKSSDRRGSRRRRTKP